MRLADQRQRVDQAWQRLSGLVQAIDLEPSQGAGHGARLFSRLGVALQAVQALPALREAVRARAFDVGQSTRAFSRIVASWLSLVFEAADLAGDSDVSRQLVALYNLTHTKELVGQERALGSALFASGQLSAEAVHQVQDLIDSQLRGLSAFRHFASPWAQAEVDDLAQRALTDERARLRRLLLQPTAAGALQATRGADWFDACTAHMDQLRLIEDRVLQALRSLCREKCDRLEIEVAELQGLCAVPQTVSSQQALLNLARGEDESAPLFGQGQQAQNNWGGVGGSGSLGPELARQVMELVQEQSQRLQSMTAELEEARSSLLERKVVERAKGLLMAQAGLAEDEAYQALRRRAMESGQRLVDVAQALLQRTN